MNVKSVKRRTQISRVKKSKRGSVIPRSHKWSRRIKNLRANGFTHSLVVKESQVSGSGLFTRESIHKDEIIIEYTGQRITPEESIRMEVIYLAYRNARFGTTPGPSPSYFAALDDNTVLDGTNTGNVAKYINHACEPNCIMETLDVEGEGLVLVISALRDIRADEELTTDYGFTPAEFPEVNDVCSCGGRSCRGFINSTTTSSTDSETEF